MSTIKSIAAQKNWEYQKNYMYGEVDGYLITARQVIDLMNGRNNCKLIYIPLVGITNGESVTVLEYLRENKKELKLTAWEFSNAVLVLRLAETFKGYTVETFDKLITTLVEFFKTNNIACQKKCVYCDALDVEVNDTTKIDKIAYYAHSECKAKAQKDNEEVKNYYNSQKKNYGLGMLGGFLGAIIGSIPWTILAYFWGYAALLTFVIGYAAFFGYKLFGGQVTKATKWLLVIPVLFSIILSNITLVTIILIQNEIPLAFENYLFVYQYPEIGEQILRDLGIGIFFGVIGYIYIFNTIKSNEFRREIE